MEIPGQAAMRDGNIKGPYSSRPSCGNAVCAHHAVLASHGRVYGTLVRARGKGLCRRAESACGDFISEDIGWHDDDNGVRACLRFQGADARCSCSLWPVADSHSVWK